MIFTLIILYDLQSTVLPSENQCSENGSWFVLRCFIIPEMPRQPFHPVQYMPERFISAVPPRHLYKLFNCYGASAQWIVHNADKIFSFSSQFNIVQRMKSCYHQDIVILSILSALLERNNSGRADKLSWRIYGRGTLWYGKERFYS